MSVSLWIVASCLSAVNPAPARDSAEADYQAAARGYYALKSDATRRQFRHQWQNAARKFEAVASKHPKSPRAADALYTAAELFSDLSRISVLDEDMAAAQSDYQKVVEGYSKHRLADDAALALARIWLERKERPDEARKVLQKALKAPAGDRNKEIRTLLSSIEPEPHKPVAVAAAPERVRAPKGKTKSAPEPLVHAEPKASPRPSHKSESAAVHSADDSEAADLPAETSEEPLAAAAPSYGSAVLEAIERLGERSSNTAAATIARSEPPGPVPAAEPARPLSKERLKELRRGAREELSLADQLGLKIRRVVIDPGHGGHDTGAVGPSGVREKDTALAISRKLAGFLREAGLEVLLTRDEDKFVRLEDRARIANEQRGDLFISVHCNSSPSRRLRGIETYTLNTASDRYSIRLAARENSTSERGMNDLQFILADIATKANTTESSRLASQVQRQLYSNMSAKYSGVRDLGTKEALFYVLLGAKMPAILVETSFLSHAEEEKRLGTAAYQEDLARSIAEGVKGFLNLRDQLAHKGQ